MAQKPLLSRSSALAVTWAACTVGAVVCLPFAGTLVGEVGEAGAGSIAWTVYLGVFPTAIAFTTWAYALTRSTAGRMGSTTYLVPPLAILMGWAILGETPPLLALLGGVLCLTGAAMARRAPAVAAANGSIHVPRWYGGAVAPNGGRLGPLGRTPMATVVPNSGPAVS